ncbi:hypothetical protein [Pseudoroseicyclus aestuarii]|nr:hypothetical protein [Pseudoroseicyclus aestuarii]
MRMLSERKLREVTRFYDFPLPVHWDEHFVIYQTPEAFLEALSDHIPQGVPPRYEAHVRAIELPRQGRYRLWCDFIVSTPAGVTVTPTVHFCRQDEAGMRIEMVETQTCSTAMPEVAREVLVLGL